MEDISKMKVTDLITYFRKKDKKVLLKLVRDKEWVLSLSISQLNILFLNIDCELQKILLDDFDVFDKIMSIPPNRMKRSVIDLVKDEIRDYIYRHDNLLYSENGKKMLTVHLEKLSNEEITRLFDYENLNKLYNINYMKKVVNEFSVNSSLRKLIANRVRKKQFCSLVLFKIKNEVELFIYAKFDLLVDVREDGESLLIDDVKIDYDFIQKVNRKHILSLIKLIQSKESNIDHNKLFICVIKLYMIFGLDNSKKIINDFFTYATDLSLKRVSYELFKENRREFRLRNQDKFYYHGIENDFLEALSQKNFSFFKMFCLDQRDEYISSLIMEANKELSYLTEADKLNKIKEIIDDEINKRESYYRNLDISKYYNYYRENARTTKVSYIDLYNLFKDVDIDYMLSKDGKLLIREDLNHFLLGNCKKDNDCLLRLILNRHAFGLNDEIYNIINHFEDIKSIISDYPGVSLNSISDVIDISKVFLYNLRPNELDITLETLSKILNSRKYCTEDPEFILDKVMKLHVERKKKVAGAIPFISGKYADVEYQVVEFDREDLLVSGIDTDSCFKVGGKGEDFFYYCLTDPRGIVFYFEYNNVRYLLPATVNGNMLNINSIDPIVNDEGLAKKIIGAVRHMAKRLVNDSSNKIEIVTMTNIHLDRFFEQFNYEGIYIEKFIPLNTDVYCDYNKKDVTNYVVYSKSLDTLPKYFNNTDLFYQSRSLPYIISPNHEYDKERVNIRINSIAYSSIDFLLIHEKEKVKEKYYYTNKSINDYVYIVGNKDWYIGIRKDGMVDRYILPYDDRAKEEYDKYLDLIMGSLSEYKVRKKITNS